MKEGYSTIKLIGTIVILTTLIFIIGHTYSNREIPNDYSETFDMVESIPGEHSDEASTNDNLTTEKEKDKITEKDTTSEKDGTMIESTTKTKKSIEDIDTSFNDPKFSKAIFDLVNKYRKENDLNELTYSNTLEAFACVRAKEASEKWAHTRPDGRDYSTIFIEYDYDGTFVGENLANGSNDPETIFQAWLDSPSHKENIVHPRFNQIGIAIYKVSDTKYYIAQSFSD